LATWVLRELEQRQGSPDGRVTLRLPLVGVDEYGAR
jgi:hypothetical protein